MQPADLLEFLYCYGSKAAILVGFLLCTCGLFQWTNPSQYRHENYQYSSDIEHLKDQEILIRFYLAVGNTIVWNVGNCLQSTQQIFQTT
jgi:hypothetical protein